MNTYYNEGPLTHHPNRQILPFAVFSLPAGPGDKITDRGLWDSKQQVLAELLDEYFSITEVKITSLNNRIALY